MIKYVLKPNLPKDKVNTLICGTDDKLILNFFEKQGITVIKNKSNNSIDPSVSTHTDMAVLHLGSNSVLIDKLQTELKSELEKIGFTVFETSEPIQGEYPKDIRLNFAITGDYISGNFNFADENLIKNIDGKTPLSVKQGYCKCSVLVVGEKSVITDDKSIYRVLTENGFNVLLIEKGDISLKGHEYGFVGGASGKISDDMVVFFGDITLHRDFSKIDSFLKSQCCNYLCTDNGPLRDVGGIIPLLED